MDFVAQWLERATRIRKILGSIPGGAALYFFLSDPAVSSSIFVGAEREENLIRNIPTRASLRLRFLSCFGELMDADGQQHTMVADMPAGSALCVDAQPHGWKQLTSFADVRTMKMKAVQLFFDIQPEEGSSIRAETYPSFTEWLEMRENCGK